MDDLGMSERVKRHAWEAHPLGPPAAWPTSLRTMVGVVLQSRFPMTLFWGPDLRLVYNDAYAVVLGGKHPRALGAPARAVWADIWPIVGPLAEGVLAGGPATWNEDLLLPMDRKGFLEETYFTFSYSPIPGDDGRVGGVLVTCQENTERVQGDRRLETLNALGTATADCATTEEVCARAAQTLLANGRDFPFVLLYLVDADGAHATLAHPSPLPEAWRPERVALAAEAGDPWGLGATDKVRILELDPERGPLPGGAWPEPATRAAVVPLRRAQGAARGYLVAGLSPRRVLDERYLELFRLTADHLATALATVHELEEERARAQALAELDRAKSSFFSNVSHEFRTPLTLLLGPVEDAAREGGVLAQPQLGMVHRSALRMSKLVNALLDFSRIEAGRVWGTFRPVEVATFTADVASAFRSVIERAGLRFVVEGTEPPEPAWIDPEMWEKVVSNLLSNAFKFTFEGEIRVTVRPAGPGAVELVVSDTGTGVPPHEVPRLFERFHRVEGARSRTHEGSGIGLALVHELVKLHGGTVTVESEVGRGTSFVVRLPTGAHHLPRERLDPRADRPSPTTVAEAWVEESAAWIGVASAPVDPGGTAGDRVLVADDNADLRAYVCRILEPHWRVEAVADGLGALEAARRDPPDLVLTDVMMPGLDGLQLLEALRADPRTKDVPVVLLSARAGDEARVDGLAAGADDYLVKPFNARELVARVKAQLSVAATLRERSRLAEEERRIRREVELQREALRAAMAQAPTPVVLLSGPDHVVELANEPACRAWGRTQEDVHGKPLREALPELANQAFLPLLDHVYRTGEPYVGQAVPASFSNGRQVWFDFVYAAVRGPDGDIRGIQVVATDVTTHVLARDQLEALRAAAEEANRSKDAFLAMLGHELRNPLSPMVTALQLLRLRGEPTRELEVLERQVRHLTRLVDDLLDVSRITSGKVELRRRAGELAEVVRQGVELAAPLLEQRGHRLELQVPLRGLLVHADRQRLAQVVANLLTNAAKYSDPGSRIALKARADGDLVRLVVRDEGIGIAPDMLPRVFEPFTQAAQSLARSRGGLGLGLAIVRSLVAAHGGRVSARSEGQGLGSEFVVELPRLVGPADEADAPLSFGDLRPPSPSGFRILVVDDNTDAAELLRLGLEGLGHEVTTAHDGPSALDTAARVRPHLALLDLGLPVMDGYELAKLLADRQSDLRLVALTGYGLESDRRRALAAGFARHLVKPVDLDLVAGVVTELLARARG